MTWINIWSGLRYALLAILIGIATSAIINGAILLAVYNLPEQILTEPLTSQVVSIGMILLAALLATAPLIEWWYNHLRSWLDAALDGGGRDNETAD